MANPNGNRSNLIPFRRGQSGNPGGKPKNARNRIQSAFLEALAVDFETHATETIRLAREKDPCGYLRVIVSLVPKQIESSLLMDDVTDDELRAVLAYLRMSQPEDAT